MSKKLTMKAIKDDNSKYSKKKRIDFEGTDYYINIYLHFSPTKIKDMYEDLANTIQDAKKMNIDIKDSYIQEFLLFFIIKHFSDLYTPKKTKELIQFFIEFINTDYYQLIIKEYNQDEINKVVSKLFEVYEASGDIEKTTKNLQEQLELIKEKQEESNDYSGDDKVKDDVKDVL